MTTITYADWVAALDEAETTYPTERLPIVQVPSAVITGQVPDYNGRALRARAAARSIEPPETSRAQKVEAIIGTLILGATLGVLVVVIVGMALLKQDPQGGVPQTTSTIGSTLLDGVTLVGQPLINGG